MPTNRLHEASERGRSFGPKHILVVDDEADPRELMRCVLVKAGLKVTTVESVDEAIDVLVALPIDLVISDIGMPEIDGHAFVQRMRASKPWSGIPAIAVSGFTQRKDRERALHAGFDAHFTKPSDTASLLHAVLDLLASTPRKRH